MIRIKNLVWKARIWKDTRGQDMIEYALIAGLIAVAAVAGMQSVSGSISTLFDKVVTALGKVPE